MTYSIGIDFGNTTLKIVVISANKNIVYKKQQVHYGNARDMVTNMLGEITRIFPGDKIKYGMLTGVNAGLLKLSAEIANDIPCIDKGVKLLCPAAKSAIEIGSENARFLTKLSPNSPPLFAVNENCAGGTGSFFEDQMYRLGLKTEDYSEIVKDAGTVPRISGRCSVFAKTDIIHRQQEGAPISDVLLGLCYATIRNLKATIIKNLPVEKPLALGGGIVNNQGVIRAVKDIFKLSEEELLSSEDNTYIQAAGAGLLALETKAGFSVEKAIVKLKPQMDKTKLEDTTLRLPPLKLREGTKTCDPLCVEIKGTTKCSLGIDVGSTSTNLALIDREGNLIDFQYLRTKGDPQGVIKEGLQSIGDRLGDKIIIDAVGVTGSGRHLIGEMVGADTVKDEITAQAKAAVCAVPQVDTVFEIGGQDSKYISIKDESVTDFQMNKICAAGTGSFIEEQAARMNIPLSEYGDIALSAKNPVELGDRCTVFIESTISSCIAKNIGTEDILAGLCHSVIKNYLFKVVGNKAVGEHIVLQGGVCYNPAVVAAFQNIYGEKVTVSPYFAVSGAYGVAALARESIGEKTSLFKGFDLSANNEVNHNHFPDLVKENTSFYDKSKELLLGNYTGKIDKAKETIGVPYVLVVHKFFPMIKTFFEALGYNVILSHETNEEIIAASQKHAQVETCYPVKLIYGHMANLVERKVDYIFLPSILTMKHECSHVHHNYGCVYMQTAPKLVFETMGLHKKNIKLLNPIFSLDFGKRAMASAMIDVGVSLGKNKALCVKALVQGGLAVKRHTDQVEKMGKDLLAGLKPDEKVFVLVTRTYGIEDPVLNMGIPNELLKRGHKVITLSHLPAHSMDISDEYENLYWPFGQHMISGAKLIANHPNLYPVYLTNHGCGPDTMIYHLFREEMGDKPYLNIEVDEQYSKVGVITRIEAFINSIENRKTITNSKKNDFFTNLPKYPVSILKEPDKNKVLYIPNLYPYSELMADRLNKKGYYTKVLAKTNQKTLALGNSKALSKEYLSFAGLVGDVLSKMEEEREDMQFLIPQTEGAEADGMYARVIYNIISKESQNKAELVSPIMETLPFKSNLSDEIFLVLLAGDIVMASPKDQRTEIISKVTLLEELSLESLLDLIKGINLEGDKNKISLVGDPYVIFNSFLNNDMFDQLEEEGYCLSWMPLSEYFCYLWRKRCEGKEEISKIREYQLQMSRVSKSLGNDSPFARNFEELLVVADENLPQFTGANGAYRYAKSNLCENSSAVLEVASMYENTQTVLNISPRLSNKPRLCLNFEGSNQMSLEEQLYSFLYFIDLDGIIRQNLLCDKGVG